MTKLQHVGFTDMKLLLFPPVILQLPSHLSGMTELQRRDKYNKKITKYYVEIDEEDEDVDIEEEREKEEHSMDVRG